MVLEVKRIQLPEHPYAFNASIVRWHGRLWMSFREIGGSLTSDQKELFLGSLPDRGSAACSRIGIVELDEALDPLGPAQILGESLGMQDPRLIVVGEELYIVYSEWFIQDKGIDLSESNCRMFMAQLVEGKEGFSLEEMTCLKSFEGQISTRPEKNWVPFEYRGQLHLAYSLAPHIIFYPVVEEACCLTLAKTPTAANWSWGELRGGTPALAIDKDHFLAFFHSSTNMITPDSGGELLPCYFMGAYLFDRRDPFTITHMSAEPIMAEVFYTGEIYEPYWHPVRVVFPCGFIVDEDAFWVSYGRQDHEIWLVKLDREKLLDSLKLIDVQ